MVSDATSYATYFGREPLVNDDVKKQSCKLCGKVGKVVYNILDSTLLSNISPKAIVAIVITAATIIGAVYVGIIPLSIVLVAIGVISIALLIFEVIRLRKKVIYEASLLITILKNKDKDWWNEVADGIVLSALPLDHQLKDICNRGGVEAVLCMTESFEVKKNLVNPVSKETWEENGIVFEHIEAEDFEGVKKELIDKGVEFIHKQHEAGKKALVHCKAGRGRSATIVVAYLMKYGAKVDGKKMEFSSFDEAYDFVKERRPVINLNKNQRKAIENWWLEVDANSYA